MKVYTKTGDKGESSLFDGRRLKKSDLRFEVYGEFDRLNVMIGEACLELEGKPAESYLRELQANIFSLSSILATENPDNLTDKVKEIKWFELTERLECNMDNYDRELPELTSFVLPGGTRSAIVLHHCRVQTRKCERLLVALGEVAEFDLNILKFVNRLSDFFFVAARYANFKNKMDELSWLLYMVLNVKCLPNVPVETNGNSIFLKRLDDVKNLVRQRIMEWKGGNEDNLFICIDGMPGTGKSTLTDVVSEMIRDIDVQTLICQRDWFTGTERGSEERLEMTFTEDANRFFKLYYNRSELMELSMALATRSEGFGYKTECFYNRLTGKFQPAVIEIPDARRIVCFEGVGAMELMDTVLGSVMDEVRARCEVLNCFVQADKDIAISDAAGRQSDALEARRKQYEREYEMLSNYVYPWRKVADIVFDTTSTRIQAA